MKRALVLVAMVVSATLVPTLAEAETTVSGIISSDTTWTTEGSPYRVTDTVQIPEGLTLTIEAGVVVTAGSGINEMFLVHGSLIAMGTSDQPIVIDGGSEATIISPRESPESMRVDLQGVELRHATAFWSAVGYEQQGAFRLVDSLIYDVANPSFLWTYPSTTSPVAFTIEDNVFVDSGGFRILLAYGGDVVIRNNRVVGLTGYDSGWLTERPGSGGTRTIEQNAFADIDSGYAIALTPNSWESYVATNNYWGPEADDAPSLIWDSNDDISIEGEVLFAPVLATEPAGVPDMPLVEEHARVISRRRVDLGRHNDLRGSVTSDEPACVIPNEPILLDRRTRSGAWDNYSRAYVAEDGTYKFFLRHNDQQQTYRVRVKTRSPGRLDICLAAKSALITVRP